MKRCVNQHQNIMPFGQLAPALSETRTGTCYSAPSGITTLYAMPRVLLEPSCRRSACPVSTSSPSTHLPPQSPLPIHLPNIRFAFPANAPTLFFAKANPPASAIPHPTAPTAPNTPAAAPAMAAPCKNANGDPAATAPSDACHAAAMLPATGPVALNPITPRIPGAARLKMISALPNKMAYDWTRWARIQAPKASIVCDSAAPQFRTAWS